MNELITEIQSLHSVLSNLTFFVMLIAISLFLMLICKDMGGHK